MVGVYHYVSTSRLVFGAAVFSVGERVEAGIKSVQALLEIMIWTLERGNWDGLPKTEGCDVQCRSYSLLAELLDTMPYFGFVKIDTLGSIDL